jgi:hypothetical protein
VAPASGYATGMTERQPDQSGNPGQQDSGAGKTEEHRTGGLDPAPATPTEEKAEPEAGTGSADKRSPESQAEQEGPPSTADEKPGTAGGDITR